MLFCIHAGTIGPCSRFFTLIGKLGRLHHAQPAILVGVVDDQVGVLQHFVVDRDQHAFDRRQHVDALAFALHRAQLLSLAHPAIQVGEFDGVDLAEQISGECIDADARVLPAFVQHPGVARMEAVVFGNFEACRAST